SDTNFGPRTTSKLYDSSAPLNPKFAFGLAARMGANFGFGALARRRHRPARQHAHEMGAIFGAAVDVARHPVGRNGHAFERLGAEALAQGLLEGGHAEHAVRARAGHRDPDLRAALGDEHPDQRV